MIPVSIDYEKCTGCSLCVQVSPRCFSMTGDKVTLLVDEASCTLCGRCVAVCPSEAVTHHVMDMGNFLDVSDRPLIDTDDFIEFIRERRSHRAFLDKKIPKEHLKKLIDTVRYAPTGHNDQTVEIIIVENPERRKKLSNLAVDFMAGSLKKEEKKLDTLKSSGEGTPAQMAELEGWVGFLRMFVEARDAGFDPVFYEASAVAIFHSPMTSVTPKDNCVIASTTMGLLARTFGLETTYIALFEAAAKGHKPLRDELRLPEGHEVLSVIILGYPRVRYLRTVDRKPIKTRWE
ncbi:MAG: nitroreductase family protein [Syntrophorhabdales bacterium]|jgi:nitroreductase/NAD-dependent dihydropyrimidine dehydrogenase PreA subunit